MRLRLRKTHLLIGAAVGGAGILYGSMLPDAVRWRGQIDLFASPAPASLDQGRRSEPAWVASAPGRVEPVSGEVRLDALVLGRVAEVLVKVGDRVGAGDLLVRIDDAEARARLAAAEAQALLRKRERDGVRVCCAAADLRKAEDAAFDADQALAAARQTLDRHCQARASAATLTDARERIAEAERRLQDAREELVRRKAAAKAPGARATLLAAARAEVAAAQALFDKTRVRAPFAATILQLPARAGETASPQRPLVVLADLSQLRVRADLDERNAAGVSVGQAALIRSESFAEPIHGKVAAIAPALVPPQAAVNGGRRPPEGNVVEVLVELAAPPPLMPGMQVDVYFLQPDAG
jgi:HlyD family secretion protein